MRDNFQPLENSTPRCRACGKLRVLRPLLPFGLWVAQGADTARHAGEATASAPVSEVRHQGSGDHHPGAPRGMKNSPKRFVYPFTPARYNRFDRRTPPGRRAKRWPILGAGMTLLTATTAQAKPTDAQLRDAIFSMQEMYKTAGRLAGYRDVCEQRPKGDALERTLHQYLNSKIVSKVFDYQTYMEMFRSERALSVLEHDRQFCSQATAQALEDDASDANQRSGSALRAVFEAM